MPTLSLIHAPDPIFKKKAELVEKVDNEIRAIVDNMFETLEFEKAVGIGANMVGILKSIAIVDLHENNISTPFTFINPEIYWKSDEVQEFEEASICFAGISAKITRPKIIKLRYLDYDGKEQDLEAEGFFSTVIQHEIDYLNGITFLDHLSRTKREMLIKKVFKFIKQNPPHVHNEHCNH